MKKTTKTIIIGISITLLTLILTIFLIYIFYVKENNQEQTNINPPNEIKTEEQESISNEEEKTETNMKEEENNSSNTNLKPENKVIIYLFHGNECPACNNAITYMKENYDKFKNYEIKMIEVWHNENNQKLLKKVEEKLNIDITGIPFFIIGNYTKTGYNEEEIIKTAKEMEYNKNYQDIINTILNENKNLNPTIETLKKN